MSIEKKITNIFEAPIPWDELPRSGHYLSGKDDTIMTKRVIMGEINKIKDALKKMSWKKINWERSGSDYYPILPTAIITMMNSLLNGRNAIFQSEIATKNPTAFKETVKILFTGNFSTNSYNFKGVTGLGSYYIHMKIDSSDRTHFPNSGINENLRNTGLGKKLYRGLIEQAPNGWVQTNSGGTEIKNWMWAALSHEQYDDNGRRDKDAEIYSFRFGDSLYAISTTKPLEEILRNGYTVINKISDKSTLATKETRLANNIGIDGDFIALCKRNKTNQYASQILSWVNISSRDAARIAREAEKRRLEEEKRKNALLKDRLKAYCGVTKISDLSSDFEEGDWIVVKSYLLQHDYQGLPVRKVTKVGNTWKATALSGQHAQRETTNKTDWVKALAPAVGSDYPPGTNGVPANTSRRRNSSPRGPRNTNNTATTNSTQTPTSTEYSTITMYLNDNNVFSGNNSAEKDRIYNFSNIERRRFRNTYFNDNDVIWVPQQQFLNINYKINNNAIFGFCINTTYVTNTKTMEVSQSLEPNIINNIKSMCTEYKLKTVEKRELSDGDLVLIIQHGKFFGYVAKVMGTSLTTRGDKYIYLRVPGATRDRLTLTPQSIKKLVPVTNESIRNENVNLEKQTPNFDKYLQILRNKILNESISNDEVINKIISYCEELINTDLIPNDSQEELQNELNKLKDNQESKIRELLDEYNNSDLLPWNNDGYLEEPDEILNLFHEYNLNI